MPNYETREFTTDQLDELCVDGGGKCVVLDEIYDHTRWSVVHRVVFLFEGEFYEVTYEEPATEHQEVETWGYGDTVKSRRMKPVSVTTVSFKPIPVS